MDLRLKGKRAIVTGASRGIGKVIARTLAEEGVDIVIAARGRAKLEETASELALMTGRRIVPIVANTAEQESVDAMAEQAVATLGSIDILINAAALPGGISSARALDQIVDSEALEDINIKVIGYLRTARAVAPHMIANGWGRIINIGGLALYTTGRPVATLRNVGVAAITKNLADELGPKGINVTAVHPGMTRTEATSAEMETIAIGRNTIGRMVEAQDIARVVTFLASPLSVAINGDAIEAGGGSPGIIRY
ncbi:SDR family oxidoreductase [Cupriavidus oxalaticus]|uniref:SDR family NAD(P)-dependent oxidoreductase n=1 Tax=Cupriavidus oxalaticus TaxID=96344 RepID=UPI00317471B1